jgi:hypothetical protein
MEDGSGDVAISGAPQGPEAAGSLTADLQPAANRNFRSKL